MAVNQHRHRTLKNSRDILLIRKPYGRTVCKILEVPRDIEPWQLKRAKEKDRVTLVTCWLFASHIQNLSVIHTVRYRRYWPSSIQDACQVSGHALSITASLQLSELSSCPVFGRSQVRILLRTLCPTPLNLYIHHLFLFYWETDQLLFFSCYRFWRNILLSYHKKNLRPSSSVDLFTYRA